MLLVALLFGPIQDSPASISWSRQPGQSSKGLTFHLITLEHNMPIFIHLPRWH